MVLTIKIYPYVSKEEKEKEEDNRNDDKKDDKNKEEGDNRKIIIEGIMNAM